MESLTTTPSSTDAVVDVDYDQRYDLTIVFPRKDGGMRVLQSRKAFGANEYETFTQQRFVVEMLGLRTNTDGGNEVEFMHAASRVLKTPRCFLDDNGRARVKTVVDLARKASTARRGKDVNPGRKTSSANGTVQEEAEAEQREDMKQMLQQEYVREIGNAEPTTQLRFSELVAKAISRRLQLACGLETHMFLSVDGDEIICTVKADAKDLMTEADRTDYSVQTLNMPFGVAFPSAGDKQHNDFVSRQNKQFHERYKQSKMLSRSIDDMRDCCGGPTTQPATMDPSLFIQRKHATLQKTLAKAGHNETHASAPGAGPVYLAPYVAFKEEPNFRPYYRVYDEVAESHEEGAGLFRAIDRVRLVGSIVKRHLNIPSLEHAGHVSDYFAPHQPEELDWLSKNWALDFSPRAQLSQPIGRVRNYFGEKIALYFAWLEFYARALFAPALVGLAIFSMNFATGKKEGFSLIVFGGLVSLWSTLFCEMWKRRNAFLNLWWGTSSFAMQEQERPAFQGRSRMSAANDEYEIAHVDKKRYYIKMLVGACTVITMILGVLGAIAGIFILKQHGIDSCEGKEDQDKCVARMAKYAGIANAVQIGVLNAVYRTVAQKINQWENHRTDSDYENTLIAKTFLFQFVNSYASFFYIAFIKRHVTSPSARDLQKYTLAGIDLGYTELEAAKRADNPCLVNSDGVPDCIGELQTQLASIFITRLVIGNFFEVVVPLGKVYLRKYLEKRSTGGEDIVYTQPEAETKLNKYEEMESFDDYAEMILQYGFVTLFVVSFPLTPLLALINNVVEVHVDAFKLCQGHRRPWPRAAASIGTWAYFLNVMSTMSVVTNTGLLIFTADISGLPTSVGAKWLMFMIAEHILLLIKKAVTDFVPDEEQFVGKLISRHQYMENKVFRGLADDDDDGLNEQAEQLNVDIFPNPRDGGETQRFASKGGDQKGIEMSSIVVRTGTAQT